MGGGRGRGRAWRRGKPLDVFPAHCLFIFCFQLRAAEVEIKDLQSEFELEKIDYLATIRRQERDFLLFQQLLEQVQPLIRRDCNYSNLEKIRRESCWDEDNGFWKIPEPIIIKTSLPAGQGLCCCCPPPLPPALLHSLLSHRLTGGPCTPPSWLWGQQTVDPGYPECRGPESDTRGLEFWLQQLLSALGTQCFHL